jgi:hypothetical protein
MITVALFHSFPTAVFACVIILASYRRVNGREVSIIWSVHALFSYHCPK